ncbi:MAG TPA: amino acid permease [Bryobacteraceae bacterium]|nr:amino acid permease [Bryobacteraceae bacterium]
MATELPRKLGLIDSLAIVIGVVIGGGIFLVPNLVARNLTTDPAILAVWAFAGVVSFFGALACAELGSAFPATGGQYVFLREAYGPLAAFLCGWSMFAVARSAQVAWLSVIFGLYVSYFIPMSPWATKLLGLAVIALLTAVNYRGVRFGAAIQKSFTLAKLVGLLVIIVGAFLLAKHSAPTVSAPAAVPALSSFGVALIACLMSYDGWVQLSFVAGEIRNPKRNVLLALAIGCATVMVVYLLANLAYLRVLAIPEIAASDHVGASAAERILGPAGGSVVSLIILVSILGTLNGCFLTSPRVYFAQAADGLFFRKFAEVHPRFQTPAFAIAAQAVWAAVLVVTGSYETLVDYALFATWIFYGLMVAGVMVLRRKRPEVPRPYRMWGYPVTPLLFVAITAWFLVNTLVTRPGPALAGLGLIAIGIPIFYIWAPKAQGDTLQTAASPSE